LSHAHEFAKIFIYRRCDSRGFVTGRDQTIEALPVVDTAESGIVAKFSSFTRRRLVAATIALLATHS
jgi:hypothetical protein